MTKIRFTVLAFLLFVVTLATAQTRGVAKDAIPGDNNLRYYRLALPVTVSAYQQDFGSDYNNDRIKLRLKGKSPVQYRTLYQ